MTELEDLRAVRIADRDYLPYVRARVETARSRIWVSMFIYDLRPGRDVAGHVLALTDALIERNAVGVDVRVLLNGRVASPDIAVANLATGLMLERCAVPTRRVFGAAGTELPDETQSPEESRSGSHAKLVIIDQVAVVGSQNWTDDAFRLNAEDAVAVSGGGVEVLAARFLDDWALGRGLPSGSD